MCETGLLSILKELIHAQNFAGNLQLVLLIFAWLPIIGLAIYFEQQELTCDIDVRKKDYTNKLCTMQYSHSEQHFWTAMKKGLASGIGLLVYVTWLVYLPYVWYKIPNEERQEPRLFRRPGIRKYYIPQIILRLLFFTAFIVVILVPPTDSDFFSFPAKFNCTREDNTTTVLCLDTKYKGKAQFSIAVLVFAGVLLSLAVCEVTAELCSIRSTDESTEDNSELQPLDNSENNTPNSYQDQLKERIRNLTNWKKKLFCTDRDVKFDKIFTDLIIFKGRVSHKLKQADLYEREGNLWQYAQPSGIKTKLDKLEDLVKPLGEEEVAPKNIFVMGRAGIGKTMFCENIIRGWAKDRLYAEEYDYAFLLNFRQLNKIKHEISLRNLLNASSHSVPLDEGTFTGIKASPEKVLLIFDGFDEFLDQENFKEVAESLPERGEDDVMPVQALYYKLCTGKLLPNATVITTSRASQAADSIRDDREVNNPRTVEILGFDKKKIKEYVKNYFDGNNPKSAAVSEYITSRPDLLALCYVPMNCFLVCYCLEKEEDLSEDTLPVTLTELYQRIVKVFLDRHYKSGGEPTAKTEQKPLNDATVKALSRVAYDGIKNRQLVFDKEMENLPLEDLTSCGIIHEMPGIVTQEMEFAPQYIFLHLTIQEFLAARHIVQEFTADKFETFITSAVSESKWEVVLQFVAGLFSAENKPELRDEMFKRLRTRRRNLLFTKCLFEQHDEAFVKTSTEDISHEINLRWSEVTDADCTAISFVWQHTACGSTRSMNLADNHIGPAGCAELRRLLQSEITELDLTDNQVGHVGAKHLKEALQHRNCKLQKLNLQSNKIGAEGAKHLKEALQHSNCKLQELNLGRNKIGAEGFKHLKEALQHSNCKLQKLYLQLNVIDTEGVKHLKEALQHSNCKLQKLYLQLNVVDAEGVKHLKEALQHSNCKLQELNLLGANKIGAEGVKHIKEALQHRNCKLQELNLGSNKIGAEGVKHLKEALQHSNCKLQELNLGNNKIDTEGVKHLKEALQHSNCKLQELNLGSNKIDTEGVKHLKEALQHSNCKLQELNLDNNKIDTEGVKHLKEALQHRNCKLQELNLGSNKIGAEGVKHLKEALQHSNCKLQELNLGSNKIGAEGAKHLKEALQHSNCTLQQLWLSVNGIDTEGVKHLKEALQHSNCKLQFTRQ